jgi:hypothetical protein
MFYWQVRHLRSHLHGAVRHFVQIISRGTEKVNALKSPAAFFFKTREIARGSVDPSEFPTPRPAAHLHTRTADTADQMIKQLPAKMASRAWTT